MRMDGQTDITFDYVAWLTGDQARIQYLIDNPGATSDDLELIDESGYIRNVSHTSGTFSTSPDTQYFLPTPDDIAVNAEVSYDVFRDRMFPAAAEGEGGPDHYLTFVKFSINNTGNIVKIEYLYTA